MTNVLDSFVDKKNAESMFLSLGDGESVRILKLREIKIITKAGFGGEEKEVLRLVCDVETIQGIKTKNFDNGTARFAKELQEKGIKLGDSFTLTRTGLMTKTRYAISGASVAPAYTPPAPAPTTPADIDEAEANAHAVFPSVEVGGDEPFKS